jgi:outer membrane immunogenic protein
MKTFALAGILFGIAAASSSARGADLSPMPVKAPAPIPSAGWTGFYVGGDIGLRSTRDDITTDAFAFGAFPLILTGTANSQPLDGTAFRVGGYAGYNWQFAASWVAGIEGDVGWAGKSATLNGVFLPGHPFLMPGDPSASLSARTTWDGSIRGRIGYLVTPSTLVYGTGGVAWQHFDTTATCSILICGVPVVTFSNSSTRAGWTVGGGLETRLQSNWLIRAEYRYADFGTVTYQNTVLGDTATYEERLRTHTALVGLTYQFGPGWTSEAAAVSPLLVKAPVAPSRSWSGAYAGVDVGMRSTVTNATENGVTINGLAAPCVFAAFVPPQGCVASEPMNGTAFRFSGFFGYDWQFAGPWVVGIEGEAGSADRRSTFNGSALPGNINGFLFPIGSFSGLAGDAFSVRTSWDASLRGRLGFIATPSLMLYVTGGPAWLRIESTSTCGLSPAGLCFSTMSPLSITNSTTKLGWTIGGGMEARLWGNWFGRAEYSYADYGTTSYVNTVVNTPGGGFGPFLYKDSYSLNIQTHTATMGILYRF